MAVMIRLQKTGRKNRPHFRLAAMDGRVKRDGKVLENLGHYDPVAKDLDQALVVKEERVRHWLARGAQPTKAALDLLKKKGIKLAAKKKAKKKKKSAKK